MRVNKNILKIFSTIACIAISSCANNVIKQDNFEKEKGRNEQEEQMLYAVESGDVKRVEELSDDDRVGNETINLAFWCAARNGNIEIVRFLNEKKTIEHKTFQDSIVWAAACGRFDVVAFLESKVFEQKFIDRAFFGAAANGHIDIVRLLIDRVDTEIKENAFMRAAVCGYDEIVKFLRSEISLRSAIEKAIANRWYNEIEALVSIANQGTRESAFIKAAIAGDVYAVEILKPQTMDMSVKRFAISLAKRNGAIRVVNLLEN